MPNHVTTRCIITGPADKIEAFKAAHIRIQTFDDGRQADEPSLDFETIIPMPGCLKGSSSSSAVSDGLLILGKGDLIRNSFGPRTLAEMRQSYPWAAKYATDDDLKAYLMERTPECIALAERAVEMRRQTGHADWYSWSLANWGTKWNSYGFHVISDEAERLEFLMDTAWSFPQPIFEKIAEMYPDLEFEMASFDEGWNFALTARIEDGSLFIHEAEASDELYERVHGYPPEHYDDEDEATA